METHHYLHHLLAPRRIAILGADEHPTSVGGAILRNLIRSGFRGTVYPIHARRKAISGFEAYPHMRYVPGDIDLGVLPGPIEEILPQIDACVAKGVKALCLLAPDFSNRITHPSDILATIRQECLSHRIHCLGPDSSGFIRPHLKLNVSTCLHQPLAGRLAFISESSTLAATILDWSIEKDIGFSTFVTLGAQVDVDFADLIDFLGADPETRGIVLYMESVRNGRRFMSAARAFARSKPIVVVRGGRYLASTEISISRTGSLVREDQVYDAVFKRAGMIRVEEVRELLHLLETLTKQKIPHGNRLVIVTNASGPAALATDTLIRNGGRLASLSPSAKSALSSALPTHHALFNPINVLSDASPERFCQVLEACLNDESADGILVIWAPQIETDPVVTAEKVAELARRYPQRPLLGSWMGTGPVSQGRAILSRGGVPSFLAPEHAVRSFLYMYNYHRNLELLYETPSPILGDFRPDFERVQDIMEEAAQMRKRVLGRKEAKEVLEAYGIKCLPMRWAATAEEALSAADELGYPVALKIDSPDIVPGDRSEDFGSRVCREAVHSAFEIMRERFTQVLSHARFDGVIIEPMVPWPGQKLAFGSTKDPVFGSVIFFGIGGKAVEVVRDLAVGLPPLNQTLARRLMEETQVYSFLKEKQSRSINLSLLERVLVRFSQLILDFPQIEEVDVNPFYLGTKEGVCMNIRIVMEETFVSGGYVPERTSCPDNLAVCPYPSRHVREGQFIDGRSYTVRPIRPEDEPLLQDLFATFSERTILMRFFQPLKTITREQMVRYCHIDYDREMVLVAEVRDVSQTRLVGMGSLNCLTDGESAEMAVVVGDPWQGQGIGKTLCKHCLNVAQEQGIKRVMMDIQRNNRVMFGLAQGLGFCQVPSGETGVVRVVLELKV